MTCETHASAPSSYAHPAVYSHRFLSSGAHVALQSGGGGAGTPEGRIQGLSSEDSLLAKFVFVSGVLSELRRCALL